MDGMGWFRCPSNNGRDSNDDLGALPLFACGGHLPPPPPPTNDSFASFQPLQLQPQVQLLSADAVEWQMAPDLPLATDPATVVTGGPGQVITASPLLQPEDLLHPAEAPNLDRVMQMQDPDLHQSWFANTPMWSPVADPAPLPQALLLLPVIFEAPVPSIQPPSVDPALPENMTQSASSRRGGGRSSRPKRRRRDADRPVRLVVDGALLLEPDNWAWRKYGQKLIKGSLILRSYYKCTTDKNCKAKKYMERCSIDPMYLKVTYIDIHCHSMPLVINSVAGAANVDPAPVPAPPPSTMAASLSPTTPLPPLAPFPKIPAVEGPPPAPALPAFAPPQLPPFLRFTGVGGTPLAPPAPAIAPSAELDVEDYRDTMATGMELNEKLMFVKPNDKPLDVLPFPFLTPEDLAPTYYHGVEEEENNNNNFMFPMPFETAASSSGGDDSITGTAPVANFVDETFCVETWGSLCGWQ